MGKQSKKITPMESSKPSLITLYMIILLFLIIAGAIIGYRLLSFNIIRGYLLSDQPEMNQKAERILLEKGQDAVSYLHKMLYSKNSTLIIKLKPTLEKVHDKVFERILPELEEILGDTPSETTDSVSAVLFSRGNVYNKIPDKNGFLWVKRYENNKRILISLLSFQLIHSAESAYRAAAAKKLGEIADSRATERLTAALLNDADWHVRENCAESIGAIGNKTATNILINCLRKDPISFVRSACAASLGKIKTEDSYYVLLNSFILDNDSSVRFWSAMALGDLGDGRAVPYMLECIKNEPDSDLKTALFECILKLDTNKSAIPTFMELLESDPNSEVRYLAARSLGRLSAIDAIQVLEKASISDPDESVREESINALHKIQSR